MRFMLLVLLVLPFQLFSAESVAVTLHEFIFETPPTPACHASTIVETSSGQLLASWFGGTAEGKPDVGIWVSRLEGNAWSKPVEVANGRQPDGKTLPCWNPVLFQPRAANGNSPLMLFYKIGPSPSTWWGLLRTSTDDGKTWSEPRRLPDGILGPIKNKPVQLSNGDILSPTSDETKGWRVYFERSNDLGATWTKSDFLNEGKQIGAIQPSVLFLGGEKLLAIGRTRQKRVFQITSPDNGKTWGEMTLTSLPNPNSGTDAVTLKDGRHILIYNHTEEKRSPLNLALSSDGVNWQMVATLESEPGEYSYPAIIQTADGRIHATYTWKRQKIKHVVVELGK